VLDAAGVEDEVLGAAQRLPVQIVHENRHKPLGHLRLADARVVEPELAPPVAARVVAQRVSVGGAARVGERRVEVLDVRGQPGIACLDVEVEPQDVERTGVAHRQAR
jgi:hypothetical protein